MNQKHITRYADEAAYDQDFDNLDFPNVSLLEAEKEVRYMEEHPYLIWGKSTATSPFTLKINGKYRKVTLDPTTGDWSINIKLYMPLTRLNSFVENETSVSAVNFPKSFDTSNVNTLEKMFSSCSSITSVGDLSNWNVGNVTNMNRMFSSCSNLTSLDVSNFDTSKVTEMGEMFRGCKNLTTLKMCGIGDGFNRVSMDNYSPFDTCSKLANIPSCGDIHNTVAFNYSPLTLTSAKVVLNALSTPYSGNQTLTFSTTTKGYINADSEALAIVAEKQAMGWTIAL